MKLMILLGAILFSISGIAHEGAHGPEQKMAPHGGALRESKNLFYEFVKDDSGPRIYILDHNGKGVPIQDTKVDEKGTQILDAKKKKLDLQIVPNEDHFKVQFKENGSYKYNLTFVVTYKGKPEKAVNWQIEP